MASISGSVGRGGLNRSEDVTTVQRFLNLSVPPGGTALVVDGLVGPKTIGAINEFQRRVVKCVPDGRVDPEGRTMRALGALETSSPGARPPPGAPAVAGVPASPLPKAFVDNEAALEQCFVGNEKAWWADFQKACRDSVKGWGVLFNVVTTLKEAQKLANLYLQARRWGVPIDTFLGWLKPMYGLGRVLDPAEKEAIDLLVKVPAASALGTVLKQLGTLGKFASFAKFMVEYIGYWRQGDYHMAFVQIYKTAMGDRIPLAKLADALETALASSQFGRGDPKRNGLFFQLVRLINLIGLGALAVDTAGVIVCGAVEGDMDLARFRRLMERMRSSPGQLFVNLGDDLATALVRIADMSDGQFREMFSLSSMKEMFDYALSGVVST